MSFVSEKRLFTTATKMKYKFVALGLFLLARNYAFYALKNE
jgi:hypothetical protein